MASPANSLSLAQGVNYETKRDQAPLDEIALEQLTIDDKVFYETIAAVLEESMAEILGEVVNEAHREVLKEEAELDREDENENDDDEEEAITLSSDILFSDFLSEKELREKSNANTLEYLVLDAEKQALKTKEERFEKIKSELIKLKDILNRNPHIKIKTLLIVELLPWVINSSRANEFKDFLPDWYPLLFDFLPGTGITGFIFQNLMPRLILNKYITFTDEPCHYGPEDPISFCDKLYELGIRELHLDNTSFASQLPPILFIAKKDDIKTFWESCCTCRALACWTLACCIFPLFPLCCGINPNNFCYGPQEAEKKEMISKIQDYLFKIELCLVRFKKLGLSNFKFIEEITKYGKGYSKYMLEECNKLFSHFGGFALHFSFRQHNFNTLGLSNFPFHCFDSFALQHLFEVICKENSLKTLAFSNTQFNLEGYTENIEAIAKILVKSRLQNICFSYTDVPLKLSRPFDLVQISRPICKTSS